MQIDLSRIRGEPFRWQEVKAVPAVSFERPELEALGEIDWRGRVVWAEPGFFLTARLSYEQTLVCTRCLAPFTEPVSTEVELLLLMEEREAGRSETTRDDAASEASEERELSEGDLGVVTVFGDRFDTDPFLCEQIQLNIPMKPLCRPDCRGLCPSCGADRNREECSCREPVSDPRWDALAGLKKRLNEKS